MRNWVGLIALCACASSEQKLKPVPAGVRTSLVEIESHAKAPGHVMAYVRADGEAADALSGLDPAKFTVLEDGLLISTFEAKLQVLHPVPAAHYMVVLLDLSRSVTAATPVDKLKSVVQQVKARAAAPQVKVAVCAFDGSPKPMLLSDFDAPADALAGELDRFAAVDPSTNLHGAVVQGAAYLRGALAKAPEPLKFGTLVLVSDGTDRARRLAAEDMLRSLDDSAFNTFVIGVGGEMNQAMLERIGRGGHVVIDGKPESIDSALNAVHARLQKQLRRIYLFSYCSPARAGSHVLRIETSTPSGEVVRMDKTFVADGFGPGCDSSVPPMIGKVLTLPQRWLPN